MNLNNMRISPGYFSSMGDLTLGQVLLILSQEHGTQVATELTRKFCLQSTSDEIQRVGLEFLYINGFYDDLYELIDKNMESLNPRNRVWAKVYKIMIYNKLVGNSFEELREELKAIKAPDPELKCLIEITIMDTYYNQREFGKVGNLIDKQFMLFDAINDEYLLSCFNQRFYQRLFIYYWKRNELIIARKYAFRALNQTTNPSTKANLHTNLGLTYSFDTYYQGMYHLKEALRIAQKHNLKRRIISIEKYNIPFLSAHFKKVRGIHSDDISEQAHIEIAKGNPDKAIQLLEGISLDSPFKMYYMGLAKQDENLLFQSYNDFIEKRRDYFFSRLPLNALKNLK
ncbi:AimR family lysis-lysogeny pheromone receptor [Ornithinibacillus halophilus]|uniref:Uncharacterized protein n=1 Tax=Ornithinibacillus halophilus TaxID=930117 RepID=A0A1M5N5W1_9BACI|nr:AimR family lysis-lysogeny pheromone receptor [Ornithinibacillus halophilus]SHG84976.1 hypothetical protein SAMN05216225_10713 [Ornithinibacillus halophilus]